MAELNLDLQVDLVSLVNSCQTESPKSAILFLSPKWPELYLPVTCNYTWSTLSHDLGNCWLSSFVWASTASWLLPLSNLQPTLNSCLYIQAPAATQLHAVRILGLSSLLSLPFSSYSLSGTTIAALTIPPSSAPRALSYFLSCLKSLFSLMYELHEF